MAYAPVQSTSIFRSGTANPTLAYGANLAAGNLAVVTISPWQRSITACAWSVGGSAAPVLAARDITTNVDNWLYTYYTKSTVSGAHTVQWTMTSGDSWLAVHEYSGIDTSAPLGPSASAGGTSTAPDSGTTTTLAQAGTMVFGQIWHDTVTGQTVTPGSSPLAFTTRQSSVNNSTAQAGTTEDARSTSTSGVKANATLSASVAWVALVVAFYEAAGAATPFPPFRRRVVRLPGAA